MSERATHCSPRRLKRGGAHNRAGRLSTQLTEQQCRSLIAAADRTYEAGKPFNRFITIAWGPCGLAPEASVAATGEWIILAREWLRVRGYSLPWAWVQEQGPILGAHCHVLLHVAPDIADLFRGHPERWSRKVVRQRGLVYARGTTETQKLRYGDNPSWSPEAYRADLWGKVHYMLKCAPSGLEQDLDMLGLGPKPWGRSCAVYGKRLAIWQGSRHRRARQVPSD